MALSAGAYSDSGVEAPFSAYLPLSGETVRCVTIPANQTTATVVVTPRDDDQAEPNELLTLGIVSSRAYFDVSGPASITIADND